jgi:putative transposase
MDQRDADLMRAMDEIHLKYPFYGSRKVRDELRDRVYQVGRGHVRRLMGKMDLHALYQKARLSEPHPGHRVYPYLLRGLEITQANHVWVTDICYLSMARGFCYLVAIMDWASRRVLAWRLSLPKINFDTSILANPSISLVSVCPNIILSAVHSVNL